MNDIAWVEAIKRELKGERQCNIRDARQPALAADAAARRRGRREQVARSFAAEWHCWSNIVGDVATTPDLLQPAWTHTGICHLNPGLPLKQYWNSILSLPLAPLKS